ncbi:MAG: RNA polymerase sigma factor [bacterium]
MQSLKNASDEEIVAITRSKDREAYAEIVGRYEKKLIRYARYLIKDENKAADAVQNAFIKAYQNLHGFNTKRKFSSWIYRIAHNEAINEAKKYGKEIDGTNIIWSLFRGREELEPETAAERDLTKKRVGECLEKLPLKYKEVLAMYYLESFSYSEIGEMLRISINTVGTRIARGKREMKMLWKR